MRGAYQDVRHPEPFAAPKRVLSLLGRADTAPFAWNAGAKTLQDQILKSITQTMQADETPTDVQIDELAAYLETLSPPPPIDLARGQPDEAAVERGRQFFLTQKCDRCHAPATYTTPRVYDVGLTDKQGNHHFNPPPLVGVGQRAPLLQDGRARSLEEVFGKFKHEVPADMSAEQLRDLLAFLRSL